MEVTFSALKRSRLWVQTRSLWRTWYFFCFFKTNLSRCWDGPNKRLFWQKQIRTSNLSRASIDPSVWRAYVYSKEHMDVSENRGTPNSSILIGFSIINHSFGVPLFLDTPKKLTFFTTTSHRIREEVGFNGNRMQRFQHFWLFCQFLFNIIMP